MTFTPRTMRFPISICLLTLFGLAAVHPGYAQDAATSPPSKSQPPAKLKQHDSITVGAHLTPEEVEEGNLNDAYEAIAQKVREGNCDSAISRLQTEVIPQAKNAKFPVNRGKFLFLANRDIGNCYLQDKKFVEAENSFQEIMQYLPAWPGMDDSDYPINLREIATAEMGQQKWQDAERSLLKSISIFDEQIAKAEKSDSDFMRGEHARNLRGSQTRSYNLLAVVYFREGRVEDAFKTADKSYGVATSHNLPLSDQTAVVNLGRKLAEVSGDPAQMKLWADRNPRQ